MGQADPGIAQISAGDFLADLVDQRGKRRILFGEPALQRSRMSLLDRLTPTLTPDMFAIINHLLADPATSFTAGPVGARDDLAVAILNPNSSTAPSDTLWNSLSELNHALGQAVSHMAGSSTAPAADFDPPVAGLVPTT